MNEAIARLWVGLIRRSAAWKPGTRAAWARVIGTLGWLVVLRRRRIADANVRVCFPELAPSERRALVRRMFCRAARGVLDYGVLWCAPLEALRGFVRVEGGERLDAAQGTPLILLAPHFIGLDAGGVRIASERRVASIYMRQSNPVWDENLRRGRGRFNEPLLIARGGAELRTALRAMQSGMPLYYLPDMDLGAANSTFVPFFGIPAATLTMVSRLARGIGARVLLVVTEQTDDGYVVHVDPPWEGFPGASVEEDTARMNREIERWARRLPDQYLWTHRRFKTRPEGSASIY
jgi:Kdo2-lipid IVA lauroyltransferase/acyltransferase